jgi:geranylgeranyl pyrophosphate synthase
MHFLNYWRRTCTQIDQALSHQIPVLFSTLGPRQIETVQHTIRGGKRIRGCLVCLVNKALGGRTENALPRAVAIECIQAASLIHDDYVDGDVTRRKHRAVWTVEGPRRAVLLGDVIFATAIQSMVELSNEDGATVARAIATVASGAYQEIFWQREKLHQSEGDIYERIIYLKTGALFGAACQLGAIATGAPPEILALAYAFGTRTGEAYQIADDLKDFSALWEHPHGRLSKLSALLPALNYFCHRTGITLPSREFYQKAMRSWCQHIGQDFISCMEQEISLRLKLAESYIERLPDNPYTQILSKAPVRIATMMHSSTLPSAVYGI